MSSCSQPQAYRIGSYWLALALCVGSVTATSGCSAAPQRDAAAVGSQPAKKRGAGRPLFSVRTLVPGERSATQVPPQVR